MRGHRISLGAIATERFWQIAVLTAAGAIGFTSQAEAAIYYWGDSEPGYNRSGPPVQPRRQRARRGQPDKKTAAAEKDTGAKPVGPLIIAISIEKQKVRVYDANGFFAESPISTGTKSHPTPMGVFSIIQKHKLHHSNIYSGAPMPFMQRITWSGVAMHAGVLPGYPASHGCIRMPMAFAARMWNWTKMGARVVVTPGEITPARFSHPLLAEQKIAPQPVAAADEPKTTAAKADKGADAGVTVKPEISEAKLELRSTVGHEHIKPVMGETSASRPLREQTHTADASSALQATNASVTMSDAGSSPANTVSAPPIVADAVSARDASQADAKLEAATTEAEPAGAKPADTASTADKPAEPAEAATAEIKPVEIETAAKTETKADEPAVLAQASGDAVKAEAPASESAQASPSEAEAVKPETSKADAIKSAEKAGTKPVESITATSATRPAAPDVKKDQTRLSNTEKSAVAKPEPPKRPGQIAVFISRKDGKLYVRENFKPLFDVPVTIAPSDRLLGTHVFTAEADKNDPNLLRWSVVSLPVSARNAQKNDDDERSSRRRKIAGAVPLEMKPLPVPNSAAEALDRITIPPDAMTRIAEALTTGGSIVVSDQGINQGGETGEGTDFIVSLR